MEGTSFQLSTEIRTLASQCSVSLRDEVVHKLSCYVELVAKWQRIANLTGSPNAIEFIRTQLVDAIAVLPFIHFQHLLDIGSGNGLPGIVLAIANEQSDITLLESRARRARFLRQAQIELGLAHVSVINERLEKLDKITIPDTLIARAVAPLRDLTFACLPLIAKGATLVAMKSGLSDSDVEEAGDLVKSTEVLRVQVPGYQERNLVFLRGTS